MNFRIHIVPSRSPAGARYMFSLDSMQAPGRAVPNRTFDSLDSLTASMRSIEVGDEQIRKMQCRLSTGKDFSLPEMWLTDAEVAKLGLYVLGEQRFSAISAVEGLQLDPEGAKRMERTQGLSSEKRRAETIQAFAQLQKQE
jgi:hypothetical protein